MGSVMGDEVREVGRGDPRRAVEVREGTQVSSFFLPCRKLLGCFTQGSNFIVLNWRKTK